MFAEDGSGLLRNVCDEIAAAAILAAGEERGGFDEEDRP